MAKENRKKAPEEVVKNFTYKTIAFEVHKLIKLTSHALVSLYRQSLTCLSSAPETSKGIVGWKATQFTPEN